MTRISGCNSCRRDSDQPFIPHFVAAYAALPGRAVLPATSASAAQEKSALNQLLAKYKADLARGMAPGTLTGLGRQIMAAAKAAGQNVPTLPRAQVSAAAAARRRRGGAGALV